jgi:hypothetical protein
MLINCFCITGPAEFAAYVTMILEIVIIIIIIIIIITATWPLTQHLNNQGLNWNI